MAFVYDTTRVLFRKLIGEIVLPAEELPTELAVEDLEEGKSRPTIQEQLDHYQEIVTKVRADNGQGSVCQLAWTGQGMVDV